MSPSPASVASGRGRRSRAHRLSLQPGTAPPSRGCLTAEGALLLALARHVVVVVVVGVVVPSPRAALSRVRTWKGRAHVRLVEPGPRHLDILDELFAATGVGGNLTTDTHLAALAIEYQAELHSNDADFSRFPGLHHRNPLR
ncbi:MAG: PIN domain-containing protein [Myxococcales bacterium]|nr:PIN domain-containing protein [Myxococcales bacterium]